MRILRLISTINRSAGGPIEGARKIDTQFIADGHDVEVVCLDEPSYVVSTDYPAPVHALGSSGGTYRYSVKLVPWLLENAIKFDVVLINGLWQYHSFGAWRALRKLNVPYFVFTHGMLDPWFKKTYPLKHLKKWLYWPWAEFRVLLDARCVLFTSEEERVLAKESFWLYRCIEQVVAYGTSTPPLESVSLKDSFFEKFPDLREKKILLYVGRIHEKKGCDILLEAFARVRSEYDRLHLIIAGPDELGLVAKLRQRSQVLGIQNDVTWPGMLIGAEKWVVFHLCNVFCLPSHQENFGIVVAEALACGKPVLISNKVNIWREVLNDGAGFVAEDSVAGTEENLRRWLDLSSDSQLTMAKNAKNCFDLRFRIEIVSAGLISLFEKELQKNIVS